jgi:7-cyano-7-deazaguanine reductase
MDKFKSLGNKTAYHFQYNKSLLETFDNKFSERDYWVKFNCSEFTCLCPITGQPDFATMHISYIPGIKMLESKSLKLYLFSFRNQGTFHEDCVNTIMNDLIEIMQPCYIEILGKFLPRGGINIEPYCNFGKQGTKYEVLAQFRLNHHNLSSEKIGNY